MTPRRKENIDGHIVEEFYWGGNLVVYVDHWYTELTYEKVVERLKKDGITAIIDSTE